VAAGGSAGGEDAGKVDVEHEVPVGVGVIGGRCAFNEAGVVDEDIEVALPRDGVGDEALDGGAISEIGGDGVVAGGGGERDRSPRLRPLGVCLGGSKPLQVTAYIDASYGVQS
jgi:hypothetical protein